MAKTLIFELVSPTALLASEEVDMIVVPGEDGDFGVLPGHTPLLCNIRTGTVDIYNGGRVSKSIFVEGGFAEANDKRCTLLATRAKELAEISHEDAIARLSAARDQIVEDDEISKVATARELALAEALNYALETRSSNKSTKLNSLSLLTKS